RVLFRSVEYLAIQRCCRILSFIAATPPEPIAVHLVVGPPQHRHLCFLQLFQVARDLVHLFHPLFVQGSPPSQHVAKLVISEATLHAGEFGGVRPWHGLKRDGILGRRRYRVPAKGDDLSLFLLPDWKSTLL